MEDAPLFRRLLRRGMGGGGGVFMRSVIVDKPWAAEGESRIFPGDRRADLGFEGDEPLSSAIGTVSLLLVLVLVIIISS